MIYIGILLVIILILQLYLLSYKRQVDRKISKFYKVVEGKDIDDMEI